MSRILLIDDDELFRQMTVDMLEDCGFEVIQAKDGKEGIAKFEENEFDLIITDVLMPNTDGMEVTLKLSRKTPKVPLLVISGGGIISPQHYFTMANSLGASGMLQKPFTQEELIEKVKSLIKKN